MKSHGMLFRPEMVRAILAGHKLVTRRPITRQNSMDPATQRMIPETVWNDGRLEPDPAAMFGVLFRFGTPGMAPIELWPRILPLHTIWVRETWAIRRMPYTSRTLDVEIVYRADDSPRTISLTHAHGGTPIVGGAKEYPAEPATRPSLLMPLWAARIVLPVSSVRAGTLADVTDEEAKLEGAGIESLPLLYFAPCTPRVAFLRLWNTIGDRPLVEATDPGPVVWRYAWEPGTVRVS